MNTRAIFNSLPAVVLALIFGSVAMWWGVSSVYEGYASSNWPKATATIQAASIGTPGVSTRGNVIPHIVYAYTVDGRSYSGSKIDTRWAWNSDTSRQVVQAYPVGSTQSVYYSLSDPGKSILLPGLHRRSFFGIVLGTLIFSFGGLFGTVGYLCGISPGGKTPIFGDGSPVPLFIVIGMIAIMCQFGLLFWTCY